ncbi:ribose import permease protein RbsC [Hypericibacter terrae]|uniref:Ribose import permease protein RbsC n=1 Tax=Hypericibacter terrae TaxID=2602015 RepID=A0A5J6MU78_9PROT|nr:ABC transporter permease [Hypericibacter terrae]QEX18376.1 ribose import permease protein RbsC [Hypericibacter terrae]
MSATATVRTAPSPTGGLVRQGLGNGTLIVIVIYAVLFAAYAIAQPDAASLSQITEQLNNALPLALAAAGGTFVVLTRGFDLSVAGVVSIANVIMATQVGDGPLGALYGLALVMAVGLVVGAVNGWLTAYVGLQSIASTLGTMIICSGIALVILDAPGGTVPDFVSYDLLDMLWNLVPVTGLIAAVVVGIWLIIQRTGFGIAIYAVGADETAATLGGIDVRRTKFLAYCLAGIFYGLAGYMLSAQTATGNPNAGSPLLLQVFAAIAIGGTSFRGGRGGLVGSMVGAATLMLLQKVLFAAGVSSFYTGLFQGVIMIIAVLIAALSAWFAQAGRR